MGRIVAIANQKGGVAKTTTAINLAAGICGHGKRVLLVDLDPQGNATTGCGIDKTEANSGVYEVLTDTMSVKDASITSTATGFDVLTANQHLAGAEIELVGSAGREVRLKTALNKVIG